MRARLSWAAAAATGLLALAACGGGDDEATDPGSRVFQAQGCGSCHTLAAADARGSIGPNLDESLEGRSREFIRRSIIDPGAEVTPGFPDGVMPETYGERLSPAELEALVDFLGGVAADG